MQSPQPSLIARDDTLLGVCAGLGEDLGFNPTYLRVALAVLLFWNPLAVIGAYLAAGAVVLATRFLVPDRPASAQAEVAAEPARAAGTETEQLPLAA